MLCLLQTSSKIRETGVSVPIHRKQRRRTVKNFPAMCGLHHCRRRREERGLERGSIWVRVLVILRQRPAT